jgi:CDP-paratose 2-epimerase
VAVAKILVTGGAGFIGSHVAEAFARDGHEVVVYDNLSRARMLGKSVGDPEHNWKYLGSLGNVTRIRGDVRDFAALAEAARGTDIIVHAAAQVAVTTSLENPREDFEVNALGTFNVLEAARREDAALLFLSTNKVYGENVNSIPVRELETRYEFADPRYERGIPEEFPVDHTGHTPYGSSKLAADIYVQDYRHTYGLRTGVFRMSCIYGTRQFGVEDQGWVAWFAIAAVTGKTITIYGNGKQVRDVLFVDDLVDAVRRFTESNASGVYNIGGGPGNTLSLLELLSILEDMGLRPSYRFSDWRPADQRVYVSDVRRAERELGWRPRIGPREGVGRLVDWVRSNAGLFERI